MKNLVKPVLIKTKQITISSLFLLLFYLPLSYFLLPLISRESEYYSVWSVWIFSIIVMVVFIIILLCIYHIRHGVEENIVIRDYENTHPGIIKDLGLVFKRELIIFYAFMLISFVCWILRYTPLGGITIVYIPLFMTNGLTPAALNDILSHIIGPVLCFAFYLLGLVWLRKRKHKFFYKFD